MEVATLVTVGAVSFGTATLAVPAITRVAVRYHLLDHPDDDRRAHARPVPRLGGVAVFAAFALAVVAAHFLERAAYGDAPPVPGKTVPLMLACSILFGIGLLDDLRGVRPVLKLLGQTLAALIVVQAGFVVRVIELPPYYQIALGWAAIPLTVLWLVGVSNAFNLVDGIDGLAGGVGVIALVAIVISKTILGGVVTAVYAVALAGALMGFLRYNVSPARIFLGDSGSLVVGFLLAYLSVRGATRMGSNEVLLGLVPVCALAYPLLDTGIAMLRRWLRGEPLSRADGRHIHHQLRALGLGPHRSVLVIYAVSCAVAALGLCATFAPPQFTVLAMLLALGVLIGIVGYGLPWLEYHEFREVGASVASLMRTGRMIVRDKIHAREVADSLRDAASFEQLTDVIEINAGRFRFVHMQLQGGLTEGAEPMVVKLHGALTWRLDYPVTREDSQVAFPIHLSIWCSTLDVDTPLSAQRVAMILAPAIGTWLAEHWSRTDVQQVLARRFPGVHTPAFIPAITGEHPMGGAHRRIRRANG